MSEENFLFVRRIGHAVRDGLGPYVLGAYKFKFTKKLYLEELQETLDEEHPFDSDDEALETLDLQAWLNAMEFNWKEVFSRKLGHFAPEAKRDTNVSSARSYVNELRRTRNMFSHEAPKDEFTNEDVYRIADTACRLLSAVKKWNEARITDEIKMELGKKLYIPEDLPRETMAAEAQPEPTAEPIIQILREPPPRIDLRGVKLRKMDLRNRKLRFAILSSAKLEESNLREEDLSEVRLDHALLKGSDLSKAKLAGADLHKANLESTQLPNAILRRAKLDRAKLRDVNMEFADLQHANLSKSDMDSANLKNADLSYANLAGANLVGTDFCGANLQGANLTGAKLEWDGRDFLRKSPTKAVFDKTTILPNGKSWTRSTNMTKFTTPPVDR